MPFNKNQPLSYPFPRNLLLITIAIFHFINQIILPIGFPMVIISGTNAKKQKIKSNSTNKMYQLFKIILQVVW